MRWSYVAMAVEVYRVMFVNQVAVNVIYFAWILKGLKLDPSISLIDDSAAATQPLCQSGWCSHSATLPEWLKQPLSHSARVAGAATQTLSHSARVAGAATQTLSHSARVAGAATHSARVAGAATQTLSHSARVAQPLSHSATVAARVAGATTQPLSHSARVAEWLMWKFPPLRVQSHNITYIHMPPALATGGTIGGRPWPRENSHMYGCHTCRALTAQTFRELLEKMWPYPFACVWSLLSTKSL